MRVNPQSDGTKAAALLPPANSSPARAPTIHLRLRADDDSASRRDLDAGLRRSACARPTSSTRRGCAKATPTNRARIARQAYAGLLWTKQFYHYSSSDWLEGDPAQPPPPPEPRTRPQSRLEASLQSRRHLHAGQVGISLVRRLGPGLPHDPVRAASIRDFAKEQLVLLLREWYMHPNGQIPAYEFAFGDVNPPVHAWACWRVYKMTGPRGGRDRVFLDRVFQKLLINFTWWVNRKDVGGQEHLLRRLSRPRQHRRVRPLPAAARRPALWSRPTAPPGWRSIA